MAFSGSNVLITGASSGLGLAVSKRFAGLGADTIVVCRTRAAGERTVAEIREEVPGAATRSLVCDLASLTSIDRLVADLAADGASLDLLFNNAAVMKRERTVTGDGFETMFQVNYLAPFILMTSLLDLVRASPTHLVLGNGRPADKLRLDFDDLQFEATYRMYDSFFRTKLCLLLACLELADRAEGEGVNIHMADPGPFKSDLVREAPWPAGWIKNLISAPVDDAAANVVHVASSDEARSGTGLVFKKRQEYPRTPYWQNTEVRARLWSTTESMLKQARSH